MYTFILSKYISYQPGTYNVCLWATQTLKKGYSVIGQQHQDSSYLKTWFFMETVCYQFIKKSNLMDEENRLNNKDNPILQPDFQIGESSTFPDRHEKSEYEPLKFKGKQILWPQKFSCKSQVLRLKENKNISHQLRRKSGKNQRKTIISNRTDGLLITLRKATTTCVATYSTCNCSGHGQQKGVSSM